MQFNMIPNDIPLPIPTWGLDGVLMPVFLVLLVVSWVVHILFINVLLGASFASVYFNSKGVKEKNPVLDRVAYLLTTPVTISENMGALWGVAPLLLVSVLFTPLFYAAAIMNSPQWLHIIYGNIAAFLLSYLYKFTWHKLENRKTLHIVIGTAAVALFFTLPFVFMATVQLYFTPTTWTHETRFWDALFRPDTFFRLVHFFLASFAVTGLFMMAYGKHKQKSKEALDAEAGTVLLRIGKSWFVVPTVLNFFAGPLVLFQFPSYGIESFFNSGYYWLIVLSVIISMACLYLVLKDFLNDHVPASRVWTVVGLMAVTIISMATLRHGMRVSLIGPAMAQAVKQSEQFQKESYEARTAPKPAPVAVDMPIGKQLAEKNGCLACHAEDKRLVGPAYREVAARGYTADKIAALVKQPVPANWPEFAQAPMPPMPQVPEAEVKQIADWINSLK
jgi:cytochrome c